MVGQLTTGNPPTPSAEPPHTAPRQGALAMPDHLAAHRPPPTKALSTRTRRWAIGVATAPLLFSVLGSARPALPPDTGLAGCNALSGAHQVAAKDYPKIDAHFADSRWPDLRISGLAYVGIATKL